MSSFTSVGSVQLRVEEKERDYEDFGYDRYPFPFPKVFLDGITESYYPQFDFSWGKDSVVVVRDGEVDIFSKSDFTELHAIDENGKECWMDGRSAPYEDCWGGKYLPERRPGQEYTITSYNTKTGQKKTYRVVLEEVTDMDETDARIIQPFIKDDPQNELYETIGNGMLAKYHGTDGNLVIPPDITQIYDFAPPFSGVKQLTIPNTFVEIFCGNLFPDLEEITVSDDHPVFCVKDGCLIYKPEKSLVCVTKNGKIPNDGSISAIHSYAFAGIPELTEIELPDSVQEIGSGVFEDCRNLKKVKLPSDLKHIGSSAFQNCSALTAISLPAGLVSLRDRAFCRCTSLEEITIPDSVTTVGEHAFFACTGLQSASFSAATGFAPNAFESCTSLKDIPSISQANNLNLQLIHTAEQTEDDLPF